MVLGLLMAASLTRERAGNIDPGPHTASLDSEINRRYFLAPMYLTVKLSFTESANVAVKAQYLSL